MLPLQKESLDLFKCSEHIKRICSVITENRSNADSTIKEILSEAQNIAEELDIVLELPRITKRQRHRSNHPAETAEEYWKRSLLIPYLDSLLNSLNERFSDENSPAFSLLCIHPYNMLQKTVQEMKTTSEEIANFYKIDNLKIEIELWYELWKSKELDDEYLKRLNLVDVYSEAKEMLPSVKHAIEIAMALPCTTATIERSFSTLRRVKTWLRTTMGENRLNGNSITLVYEFQFLW